MASSSTTSEGLAQLRRSLRNLQKAQHRTERVGVTPVPVTLPVRKAACVMLRLCKTMNFVLDFIRREQKRRAQNSARPLQAVTDDAVQQWVNDMQDDADVARALDVLDHPIRKLVDEFLLESHIFQEILEHNGRRVHVPSP